MQEVTIGFIGIIILYGMIISILIVQIHDLSKRVYSLEKIISEKKEVI